MYILFLKYLVADWNIEQTGSSGDDSDWQQCFPDRILSETPTTVTDFVVGSWSVLVNAAVMS